VPVRRGVNLEPAKYTGCPSSHARMDDAAVRRGGPRPRSPQPGAELQARLLSQSSPCRCALRRCSRSQEHLLSAELARAHASRSEACERGLCRAHGGLGAHDAPKVHSGGWRTAQRASSSSASSGMRRCCGVRGTPRASRRRRTTQMSPQGASPYEGQLRWRTTELGVALAAAQRRAGRERKAQLPPVGSSARTGNSKW
jgi:hypothetical protein